VTSDPLREQIAALAAARNPDGGWPYFSGRRSRLEPTCFALVALEAAGVPPDAAVLQRWPSRDGLLVDSVGGAANTSDNGIALLALQRDRSTSRSELVKRLALTLAATKGAALPPSPANRQNSALQGWPWTADTFSWVEPTAWCVLALKQVVRVHPDMTIAARIAEGERLLVDRVCSQGGWNYGNANVLGKDLFPYASTTALALLALQDRQGDRAVRMSAAYLADRGIAESAGLSLALTRIALAIAAPEAAAATLRTLAAALSDTWRRTKYLGNLAATALALYAVAGQPEGHAAFRLR
jgi:hypothetical protein